jgi:membrane protein YdbS with pleckstrin-like domain
VEKQPPTHAEPQARDLVVTAEVSSALSRRELLPENFGRTITVAPLVWEGRPSLLLAIPTCVKWALILATGVALVHGWSPGGFPWGFEWPARPAWMPAWAADWRVWALFPLWRIVDTVLELACIRYELTTEHLRISTGIFSRWTDEQELYRVKKIGLWEPALLRWFGRAEVVLYTADPGVQRLALRGVPHAAWLRQTLHELVDATRERRRVHVGESI